MTGWSVSESSFALQQSFSGPGVHPSHPQPHDDWPLKVLIILLIV
jgi:hypothetical protein